MSNKNTKRSDIFTPFSRIPPIGSIKPAFTNYRVGSKAMELGLRHPTIPLRKRKLPIEKVTSKTSEPSRQLLRRKTYVVLKPLVCKVDNKKCGKKSL